MPNWGESHIWKKKNKQKKTSLQVHKLIYIFSFYLIFHTRTLKNTDYTADWSLTVREELEIQKSPFSPNFSKH